VASDPDFYFLTKAGGPEVDEGHVFDGMLFPDFPDQPMMAIVVTPTCDFHQQKDYFTHAVVLRLTPLSVLLRALAKVKNLNWDESAGRIDLRGTGKTKRESVEKFFTNLVNSNLVSFHYLPAQGPVPHSVVWFNATLGVPLTDFSKFTFVAALRSPFREHLSTRFSGYYLRVGTEDFPEMVPTLIESFATL
jgi:hypothetical protein